jgi:hypothetical protein
VYLLIAGSLLRELDRVRWRKRRLALHRRRVTDVKKRIWGRGELRGLHERVVVRQVGQVDLVGGAWTGLWIWARRLWHRLGLPSLVQLPKREFPARDADQRVEFVQRLVVERDPTP